MGITRSTVLRLLDPNATVPRCPSVRRKSDSPAPAAPLLTTDDADWMALVDASPTSDSVVYEAPVAASLSTDDDPVVIPVPASPTIAGIDFAAPAAASRASSSDVSHTASSVASRIATGSEEWNSDYEEEEGGQEEEERQIVYTDLGFHFGQRVLLLNETEICIVQPRIVAVRCPCEKESCTALVAVGKHAHLARNASKACVHCEKIFNESSFWPATSSLRYHLTTMRCIQTRKDPRLSNAN